MIQSYAISMIFSICNVVYIGKKSVCMISSNFVSSAFLSVYIRKISFITTKPTGLFSSFTSGIYVISLVNIRVAASSTLSVGCIYNCSYFFHSASINIVSHLYSNQSLYLILAYHILDEEVSAIKFNFLTF